MLRAFLIAAMLACASAIIAQQPFAGPEDVAVLSAKMGMAAGDNNLDCITAFRCLKGRINLTCKVGITFRDERGIAVGLVKPHQIFKRSFRAPVTEISHKERIVHHLQSDLKKGPKESDRYDLVYTITCERSDPLPPGASGHSTTTIVISAGGVLK